MSLSEIGPRFVLVPVKIFEGSFNGATLYENKGLSFLPVLRPLPLVDALLSRTEFVPSSSVAAGIKDARATKYRSRKGAQEEKKVRHEEIETAKVDNPLETRSVFA